MLYLLLALSPFHLERGC